MPRPCSYPLKKRRLLILMQGPLQYYLARGTLRQGKHAIR